MGLSHHEKFSEKLRAMQISPYSIYLVGHQYAMQGVIRAAGLSIIHQKKIWRKQAEVEAAATMYEHDRDYRVLDELFVRSSRGIIINFLHGGSKSPLVNCL